MPHIYYLAYGTPVTGGDYVNIEHVNALNAMGFDATLAYFGKNADKERIACRSTSVDSVQWQPEDFVVAFENHRGVLEWVSRLPCHKLMHNQNTYYLMEAVQSLAEIDAWGFESVICPSHNGIEMMRSAGYIGAADLISPCIPEFFGGGGTGDKSLLIAYSRKKRPVEAGYVRTAFHSKYPQYKDIPWMLIENIPREEVAAIERKAAIYASFAKLESVCLSVLEAMKAGCIVVGDHGGAGLEYANVTNGIWLREHEYERFADALYHAVEIFKGSGTSNAFSTAAMKTASSYSEHNFKAMLAGYWNQRIKISGNPG